MKTIYECKEFIVVEDSDRYYRLSVLRTGLDSEGIFHYYKYMEPLEFVEGVYELSQCTKDFDIATEIESVFVTWKIISKYEAPDYEHKEDDTKIITITPKNGGFLVIGEDGVSKFQTHTPQTGLRTAIDVILEVFFS